LKFKQVGQDDILSYDQAVSDGLIEGRLYRWKIDSEGSDVYEELTSASQIEPWDGCWLKTDQENVTLTIPAPEGLANAESPLPSSFDPPMSPMTPLNATRNTHQVSSI